jgi:hypothetical protein
MQKVDYIFVMMVAVGAIPLSFIKKCFRNTEISVETITTN